MGRHMYANNSSMETSQCKFCRPDLDGQLDIFLRNESSILTFCERENNRCCTVEMILSKVIQQRCVCTRVQGNRNMFFSLSCRAIFTKTTIFNSSTSTQCDQQQNFQQSAFEYICFNNFIATTCLPAITISLSLCPLFFQMQYNIRLVT